MYPNFFIHSSVNGNRDGKVVHRLVDTVGEGEGGMNSESSTGMHTLACAKHIGGGKLLLYKNLRLVLCVDLEGGMEGGVGGKLKREGIYVYLRLIHVAVQQKLTQHCKIIILQLNFFKKLA